jgi:hypothetical protein
MGNYFLRFLKSKKKLCEFAIENENKSTTNIHVNYNKN